MPESDCGLCNLLINCGGAVRTQEQFFTLAAKLLCEGVDVLGDLVESLTPSPVVGCPDGNMRVDNEDCMTVDGGDFFIVI